MMIAEEWTENKAQPGPTGRFREVLEVAVVDYGGNEFGRATTAQEIEHLQTKLRIPNRLQATRVGRAVPLEECWPGDMIACYVLDTDA